MIITQPLRTEQEDTRDLTTAIQEQAPKGLGLKSTEQSENPVQNKHPRNSSMTESGADKNPELNEKLQGASGVLLGSQATSSRSEQEKELTTAAQQKAWEIRNSGVLIDMDLELTEGSHYLAQNKIPTSSPITHDSAGQDSANDVSHNKQKGNGLDRSKLPLESSYLKLFQLVNHTLLFHAQIQMTTASCFCKICQFATNVQTRQI